MKKSLAAALLMAGLSSLAAAAATPAQGMRIAFVDREAALLASDSARAAQDKLLQEVKPQSDRLEQLRKDIRGYEEKFRKDGATMSERDKKALREQADTKAAEFNNLVQLVQKRTAEAQQELLTRTLPTINKSLDDLRKDGGFDIILEARTAVYADPSLDLTRKLTERLNAQK